MAAYKIQGSSTTDPRYANYKPNINIGTKVGGGTLQVPAGVATYKPGQVLGTQAPTSKPKTNNKPSNNSSSSSSNKSSNNNIFAEQEGLADNIYQQNLSDTLLQFDKSGAMAQDQIKSLETSKATDQSILEQALRSVLTQAGATKDNLVNQAESAIEQGASAARQATVKTRNSLRGLGILNSSAGGELLSRAGTEFQKVSADVQTQLSQGLKQVDDFITTKTEENALKVQQLVQQYADLVGRIQTDLRFNKREQLAAVKQAQLARDQMLSGIRAEQTNYMLQAEAYKNNIVSELGGVSQLANNNVGTATQKVSNIQAPVVGAQNTKQGADIYDYNKKKGINFLDYGVPKSNQGLLSGYAV